jgi:hypothetical protein
LQVWVIGLNGEVVGLFLRRWMRLKVMEDGLMVGLISGLAIVAVEMMD